MRKFIIVIVLLLAFEANVAFSQPPNTLTKQEQKDGWKLLFDGKTTDGWHIYNACKVAEGWKVEDGSLYLTKGGAGDIITDVEFENYEFSVDWKIGACGNSGIIFNVVESPNYKFTWLTGPEMQVLDNTCHSDAKIVKHRAGNLYDLIASPTESVKPAGEWNTARIVLNKGRLELWLNGVKQVETTMFSPEWDALVAGSKFKTMPGFGKSRKGRIALQDHGDPVWYRNVKFRSLN